MPKMGIVNSVARVGAGNTALATRRRKSNLQRRSLALFLAQRRLEVPRQRPAPVHVCQPVCHRVPDSPALLRRPPMVLPMPELANQYKRLGWGEINLDYSGTRPMAAAIHRNIAALAVDDELMLRQEKSGAWVLSNAQAAIVGKLSRAFVPPAGMHCIKARVAVIHVRRRKDVGEEHQARLGDQCEAWETIVPELVFTPTTTEQDSDASRKQLAAQGRRQCWSHGTGYNPDNVCRSILVVTCIR